MIYKVLDVRELMYLSSGRVCNGTYSGGNSSMSVENSREFIVIAEDEKCKRRRFHFYDGHEEKFLGEMCYYGYKGDFDILVPGDKFELVETSTYKEVQLIEEN